MNRYVDFIGVTNLLRCMVKEGVCTKTEAKKIARRIAVKYGIDPKENI